MTRPTELPELRTKAIQRIRDREETYINLQMMMGVFDNKSRQAAEVWYDQEMQRWDQSDLYYVSADMTSLASEAATSMPPFELQRHDCPSTCGLIFFDKPIAWSKQEIPPGHPDAGKDLQHPIHAVLWGNVGMPYKKEADGSNPEGFTSSHFIEVLDKTIEAISNLPEEYHPQAVALIEERIGATIPIIPGTSIIQQLQTYRQEMLDLETKADGSLGMKAGVWMSIYTLPRPDLGLVYDDEFWLAYDKHDTQSEDWKHEGNHRTQVAATIRCAWLLMQQKNITESNLAPLPERHSIKRMRRSGFDLKPVRVITLRHAIAPPSKEGVPSGREYHHRWMVRSHWRNQWYPKQKRHVPVLVPAHIKGPEGAPLLGGEKVHAWTK